MSAPRAAILAPSGPVLTEDERDFFRDADPWGFILFSRNIDTPDQTRALTVSLRDAVGRAAPILVDQEGGRVQRLRPPHWRAFPPAAREVRRRTLAQAAEALVLRYRLIAAELHDVGIDVNCAPLLDVAHKGLTDAIADRTIGRDAATVAGLGHAVRKGLTAGGVLPVIKHLPGYGRAAVDPHESLPVVRADLKTLAEDFGPFHAHADALMGMTAHLTLEAVDRERPVTFSRAAIRLIRDVIGFRGLLMTDDISMGALSGSVGDRTEASLAAGCDVVLHCNGDMDEMEEVASAAWLLENRALARAEAVDAAPRTPEEIDLEEVARRYDELNGELTDA